MRELLRVHAAPVFQQLAKCREAGRGEVGACHEGGLRPVRDVNHAARYEAGHGLGNFRMVRFGSWAPSAQEHAVGQRWIAAEVLAELVADKIALGWRERVGFGAGHARIIARPGRRPRGGCDGRCMVGSILARARCGRVGIPVGTGQAPLSARVVAAVGAFAFSWKAVPNGYAL